MTKHYTDADIQAAAKAIARRSLDGESRFTDLARTALGAVVPAIVARAKAEALREAADAQRKYKQERVASWPLSDAEQCENERCERALRRRADEIEAGR